MQSAKAQRKYDDENFGGRSQPISFQIYVPPSPRFGLSNDSRSRAQENKYYRLCNLLEEAGVYRIEAETLLPSAPPANVEQFAKTYSRWLAESSDAGISDDSDSGWNSPLGVLDNLESARSKAAFEKRNPSSTPTRAPTEPLTEEARLDLNRRYASLLDVLNGST